MEQNQLSSEKCPLCLAIEDSASVRCGTENTPIFQTENFVVLPCVGPLVIGHVLVVTRGHQLSFAELGGDAIVEYEDLRERVSHFVPDLLEAEHGATATNCGGACVVHAHIHWIPNHSKFINAFEGGFEKLYDGNELKLPQSSVPYMMLRANGRTVVYKVTHSGSIFFPCGLPFMAKSHASNVASQLSESVDKYKTESPEFASGRNIELRFPESRVFSLSGVKGGISGTRGQ